MDIDIVHKWNLYCLLIFPRSFYFLPQNRLQFSGVLTLIDQSFFIMCIRKLQNGKNNEKIKRKYTKVLKKKKTKKCFRKCIRCRVVQYKKKLNSASSLCWVLRGISLHCSYHHLQHCMLHTIALVFHSYVLIHINAFGKWNVLWNQNVLR